MHRLNNCAEVGEAGRDFSDPRDLRKPNIEGLGFKKRLLNTELQAGLQTQGLHQLR
jgi:hypothetical protein